MAPRLGAQATQEIQARFHFDTNAFLLPVEDETLNFDELFRYAGEFTAPVDNQLHPATSGSTQHSGGGWTAPTRLGSGEPGADAKSGKADAKRVRDAAASKSKQHQVKELEAMAAQKSLDFQRLALENAELRFKQQMLEKVVQLRDHQLKVMRQLHHGLPQPWGGVAPAAPCPSASGGGGGCGGGGSSTSSGGDVPAPPASWQRDLGCGGGGGSSGMPVALAVRMVSCGDTLSSPDVRLPPVDGDRFRCMGKLQLMDGWKHFLSEVTGPLLALESSPDDEAAAVQMRQLAAEACFLFKHASLLAPDTIMAVMQMHLETESESAPDPAHWATVVRTLDLTPEQVRELRAVYGLFSGIMAGILAERRALNAHLATGLHGVHADARAATEQLTVAPECEVMQAMQKNMRKEKSAHLLLRGFLFGRTLTVLQLVKASVYAYPYFPDATAVVATVAGA